MVRLRVFLLTLLAVLAFAGNSILCREALRNTQISPATFTLVRILSGACVLWLIVRFGPRAAGKVLGNWWSGLALFVYAEAFSQAYVSLPAAVGALLLFGAVQATMIGYGLWSGERLGWLQLAGLSLAAGGLIFLLLPGLSAPPLEGSVLMVSAGVAWGIYSLRGQGSANATAMTAGNFLRAACFACLVSALKLADTLYAGSHGASHGASLGAVHGVSLGAVHGVSFGVIHGASFGMVHSTITGASWDRLGLVYAIISGAITSGLGYAVWYRALRELSVTTAATVQLCVPVLAALGGVAFLGEVITLRLVIAAAAILSGVMVVIAAKQRRAGQRV
jgi:drug/metabolite transporter (DMT)-like permease